MISKKGNMVTENAIGLILAVAVTFVLIILMIALFSPTFNKGKEMAGSYFNGLQGAIAEADKYGKSSFFMLDVEDEVLDFYLIYFGESLSSVEENPDRQKALLFVQDDKEFIRSPNSGPLCVCYWQGEKTFCNDCMDLDGVINYAEKGDAPWVVRAGEYVEISKTGDNYVFVSG